uniref:Tyrosine aminotransferase n=1 Tax=Plectus sambesii TaxID=2011161 RepID=A0A914XN64_9BILA
MVLVTSSRARRSQPRIITPNKPAEGKNMYPEHVIKGLTTDTNGLNLHENCMKQQLKKDNGLLSPQRQHSPSSFEDDGLLLSTSPFCMSYDRQRKRQSPPPEREWRTLPASEHSKNTVNPIRRIVDVMSVEPNPAKSLIKLHLGDPTLTGTLPPSDAVLKALQEALMSEKYNGYGPAVGLVEVREALARHVTTPEAPVTAEDFILTSGCSHALELAIEGMANAGDNILVPRPGFPLYTTLMRPHGIEDRHYDLQMENGALVNLQHLESLIDERTRAIIVCNPSNPTGAVYSKAHLEAILRIADLYKVPVIADEIYGGMVYDGAVFYPMATLEPKVPIISCDGIAKRYLVPGWRLGWLTIHDRHGALKNVRDGLRNLAQKIVGPCALVQGALPAILDNTPAEFFEHVRNVLTLNAKAAYNTLSAVPGLKPVRPQGAMYMMIGFDADNFPAFKGDELSFVKALIAEESVYCLPGTAFHCPGWIRLVLTYPEEVTLDACERIAAFCSRHYSLRRPTVVANGCYKSSSSIGLDSERLTLNGNEFIAYDIGGHAQAVRLWKDYYPAVDAIIFIIDTSDPQKLPLAKNELSAILMEEQVANCAIAVLGNKIDRFGALSEQQLEDYFELATWRTGKQKGSAGVDRGRRPLEIFMSSITAGQGYGDAFRWINMQLS